MRLLLYRISIFIYHFLIILYSPFSLKAQKRKQGAASWQKSLSGFKGNRTLWMHCASLGEFEQGRPLLDTFARAFPDRDIILTFFSSSGYDVRKNYPKATKVCYLPNDSPIQAEKFLSIVQPELAVFVKYDLWYFFIEELKKRNINSLLIAARFHAQQSYFNSLMKPLFVKMLSNLTFIFTQDENTWTFLKSLNISNVQIKKAGDPRFDRVIEQRDFPAPLPDMDAFVNDSFCIIAGSTWSEDDRILISTINLLKEYPFTWIIAPHEISDKSFQNYKQVFQHKLLRFTEYESLNSEHTLLFIDTIGNLSSLYAFADMAYIGGGQHHRIHNIQEPAAYGLPLCFGPGYNDFTEAKDLVQSGGARSLDSAEALKEYILALWKDEALRKQMGQNNKNYIESKAGATGQIFSVLKTGGYL